MGSASQICLTALLLSRLQSIPSGITLSTITSLELRCNSLSTLPPILFEKALINLKRLDVSFNQLLTLPAEIGKLLSLEELLLSRNSLTALPDELGGCTSLEHLDLFSNKLTRLPSTVSSLQRLTRLDIGDNALDGLPVELSGASKLTRLHCYGNKVSSLPLEWKSMKKLVDVSFRWNKLTEVPQCLKTAKHLRYLDVSGNPIASIGYTGAEICDSWPALEKLNFYACKLEKLPAELLTSTKLHGLKSLLIARTPAGDVTDPGCLPQEKASPLPSTASSLGPNAILSEKDLLVDRIKGCIYGNAIGDALGLAAEFTKGVMARHFYGYLPNGLEYSDILRDDHRFNWIPGDWTDDTDQMLLILESIFEKNVRILRLVVGWLRG